jgi:RimJ/RimL family protein N-acetyltransferase
MVLLSVSLPLVAAWGFTESGAQCVVADTMAVNIASRRVLETAGLKLVRTHHQSCPNPIEGDEFGDVEYALHRADWEQQDQVGPGACPLA